MEKLPRHIEEEAVRSPPVLLAGRREGPLSRGVELGARGAPRLGAFRQRGKSQLRRARLARHGADLLHEAADRRTVLGVVEGKEVGVGEAPPRDRPQPGHRRVVAEPGIADPRDPVVVVVDRVVDAVGPVEGHVEDRNPEEVEEDRVVGAAPEAVLDEARVIFGPRLLPPSRQQRPARLRVGDRGGSGAEEGVQGGDRRDRELGPAGGGVHVQVGDPVPRQVIGVLLSPLGGGGQRELLRVPGREHDRAPGPDPAAQELPERASDLHHRRRSARRVAAAEDPGIPMIPEDHLLLGVLGPADAGNHGRDPGEPVVHLDSQADPSRPGSDVVGEGEAALPLLGGHGPAQALEDLASVLVGEGGAQDAGEGLRLFPRDAGRARDGGPAGGQRVAGHEEVVHDRAALDVALRAPRPLRIDLTLPVPVVLGVRVDEDPRRPALLRRERLEAAVAVGDGVADECDPPSDVDPHLQQPVVVLGVPAARVDDLRRRLARRRVGVVGDPDVRVLAVGIDRVGVFPEARAPADRGDHLHRDLLGIGEQHFVLDDLHVLQPVLDPAVAHPLRELPVSRGARHMRLGSEEAVSGFAARGVGQRDEQTFDRARVCDPVAGESGNPDRLGLLDSRRAGAPGEPGEPRDRDEGEAQSVGQRGRLARPPFAGLRSVCAHALGQFPETGTITCAYGVPFHITQGPPV